MHYSAGEWKRGSVAMSELVSYAPYFKRLTSRTKGEQGGAIAGSRTGATLRRFLCG